MAGRSRSWIQYNNWDFDRHFSDTLPEEILDTHLTLDHKERYEAFMRDHGPSESIVDSTLADLNHQQISALIAEMNAAEGVHEISDDEIPQLIDVPLLEEDDIDI